MDLSRDMGDGAARRRPGEKAAVGWSRKQSKEDRKASRQMGTQVQRGTTKELGPWGESDGGLNTVRIVGWRGWWRGSGQAGTSTDDGGGFEGGRAGRRILPRPGRSCSSGVL